MPRRTFLPLSAALIVLAACAGPVSRTYTTHSARAQAAPTIAVPATAAPATAAPTTTVPPQPILITGAGFDLHTSGRVGQAAFEAAWAGVLDTLNRYLEAAVLTPLRTGGPAGDLAPFFTSLAVDRVRTSPDREAFIDEGLPPLSDLRPEAAVATLTALAGSDGVMSVVAAGLDLRLAGQAAGGRVTVNRTGELVLLPEGGTWRIDAYDLKVTRTIAEATTTTTAVHG